MIVVRGKLSEVMRRAAGQLNTSCGDKLPALLGMIQVSDIRTAVTYQAGGPPLLFREKVRYRPPHINVGLGDINLGDGISRRGSE